MSTKTPNVDPREAALRALTRWAERHTTIRPRLIADAWNAGERRIAVLARAAAVSRDTVYADLAGQGINYRDRDTVRKVTTGQEITSKIQVVLTTYGVLHRGPLDQPALTFNLADALRNPPDDPTVRDQMIQLTGLDPAVHSYVMDTPGAAEIVAQAAGQILALVEGYGDPTRRLIRGHFFCRGGRHRSVVIAEEVAAWLRAAGVGVECDHLDINQPVVTT